MLSLSALHARADARTSYRKLPPSRRAEADLLQQDLVRARGTVKVVDLSKTVVVDRSACPETNSEHAPVSSRSPTPVRVAFTESTVKTLLDRAFNEEYGDHYSKTKAIANSAEASPRTVEKWPRESLPSLVAFFNMVAGKNPIPALQAEMRRLLADRDDHRIDDSRAIHEIHRMLLTMKGEP